MNAETTLIKKQISSYITWQIKNRLSLTLSYISYFEDSYEYD